MKFVTTLDNLKFTTRWMGKQVRTPENVKEHSFDVAVLASILAAISNKECGTSFDLGEIALRAVMHDVTEAITGDMPSPIKYFNTEIRDAYKAVEAEAEKQLVAMLKGEADLLIPYVEETDDVDVKAIVKAADYLSMYLYAKNETLQGNASFGTIADQLRKTLELSPVEAARVYLKRFCGG